MNQDYVEYVELDNNTNHQMNKMLHAGGFEPPKRFASDLKSDPFDQTRVRMLKFKNL